MSIAQNVTQNVTFFLVEDPSYDFIRLRDYIDALDCSKLSAFAPEHLRSGFSDKMVQQAREELKINKVSSNSDWQGSEKGGNMFALTGRICIVCMSFCTMKFITIPVFDTE